jgi:hypothetical protein
MSVPDAGTDTSSVVRILTFGNMFEWQIWTGGSVMSDMGLEAPDVDIAERYQNVMPEPEDDEPEDLPLEASTADAAEQHQDAIPEPEDDEPEELPLEASAADAVEQAREIAVDDDYR